MTSESPAALDTEALLQHVIDCAPLPSCAIDPTTLQIFYGNARYHQLMEHREKGEKRCHAVMYGLEEPCRTCKVRSAGTNPPPSGGNTRPVLAQGCLWRPSHSVIRLANRGAVCLVFFEAQSQPASFTHESQPAQVDELTGLLNYRGYEQEGATLYEMARAQGLGLASVALKLDGLYQINTVYGYDAGDETLRTFSRAVLALLPRNALFARLRRNDFLALMPLEPGSGADSLVRTLDSLCRLPAELAGTCKQMSLCQVFGGASVMEQSETFSDLNFLAWDACSRAIICAEQPYEIVEGEQLSERIALKTLKNDLEGAIARQDMELFFQPKVDADTGELVGAEALIRWNHVQRGQVSPSLFIPMAERSGQIGIIDTWVIQETCRTLQTLQARSLQLVPVSINVSPRTFFDTRLESLLLGTCERYNIDPAFIGLELTERTALRNVGLSQAIMLRLRDHGFSIAMDDFGVGYSSLSKLEMLPFDTIKVDRSFIANPSVKARKVFPSIVSLVRNHEMEIVIEGVETEEQLVMVRDAGCRYIQGYYFSYPLPFGSFADLLASSGWQGHP